MEFETFNRLVRPGSAALFAFAGFVFLFGLGAIMLYRYASFGELDWQGLTAFVVGVLFPYMQHAQNRSTERRQGVAPTAPFGSEAAGGRLQSNGAALA